MPPHEGDKRKEVKSIEIANGDHVQALVDYDFKPVITNSDDDRRWVRIVMAERKAFRVAPQSEQWLGKKMAGHFGRNVDVQGDRIWLQKTITRWENDGLIKKVMMPDDHRKDRPHWVLGDAVGEETSSHQPQEIFGAFDDDAGS
jgi:hypothetical protein